MKKIEIKEQITYKFISYKKTGNIIQKSKTQILKEFLRSTNQNQTNLEIPYHFQNSSPNGFKTRRI